MCFISKMKWIYMSILGYGPQCMSVFIKIALALALKRCWNEPIIRQTNVNDEIDKNKKREKSETTESHLYNCVLIKYGHYYDVLNARAWPTESGGVQKQRLG